MHVIVVGAGAAGLAATYTLRKHGVRVTTLEATGFTGGRARGLVKQGYVFDLGAQFAAPFYATTLGLMQELGMAGEARPFRFKSALWRNGRLYPLTPMSSAEHRWEDLRDVIGFKGISLKTLLQSARVTPRIYARYRKIDFTGWDFSNLLDLGFESIANYVLRHGGPDAMEYLCQPLTAYLTLGEPEEVSVAHFLSVLGFFVEGAYVLQHGMGSVPRALHERCAESIRIRCPVRRIVISDGTVRGVVTDEGMVEADAVICATTASAALKLMPDLPASLAHPLKRVTYSSTCHLIFGLERRLLPEGWYNIVVPRKAGFLSTGPVESASKSPEHAPAGAGCVHALTYGQRARELMALPDERLRRLMIEDIQRLVPAFPDEPPITEIVRWEEAICLQPPGQFPAIHRLKTRHYRDVKGLFLAGAYLYLLSSMEGALRSGVDAARAALA